MAPCFGYLTEVPEPPRHRRVAAALVAGWFALPVLWLIAGRLYNAIFDRLYPLYRPHLGVLFHELVRDMAVRCAVLPAVFVSMPFAAAFVVLVRFFVRAQHRATDKDLLQRLREGMMGHPRLTWLASAAPALYAVVATFLRDPPHVNGLSASLVWASSMLAGLVSVAVAALFGRGILHVLASPVAEPSPEEEHAGGYTFSAVAVTREARAAIGALGALSLAVSGALLAVPWRALLQHETGIGVGVAAYVVLAALAAALYRRAARLTLGLDGVRVSGSSRARFHAYRDLDGVTVTPSGEIHLQRGRGTPLRIQLHGPDAARRAAVVERLRASLREARASSAAHRLAEAATASHLGQAARGEVDYRRAGASREELWEVLEGSAPASAARTAAAAALSVGARAEERARLRIAAQRCAEPETRAALLRVAAGEDEDDPPEVPAARAKVVT